MSKRPIVIVLTALALAGPAIAADYSATPLPDLTVLRLQCELSRQSNSDPALRGDYPAEVKAECDAVASSFEAKIGELRSQQPAPSAVLTPAPVAEPDLQALQKLLAQ